ncbi:MAG: hypothetical protein WDM80_07335 [Limisphaerales bacterium]
MNRILANLYDMKRLQEQWNSEHDQCDGKPLSQRVSEIIVSVCPSSFSASRFCSAAMPTSWDYLPNKLICLNRQIFSLLEKVVKIFFGLLPSNLAINRIFNTGIVLLPDCSQPAQIALI